MARAHRPRRPLLHPPRAPFLPAPLLAYAGAVHPLYRRDWLALLIRFALFAGAVAFFFWVWPTAYRYDHISLENDTYPVRVHRVTGAAEMLTPDEGWVPMESPGEDPFASGDRRS